MTDNDPNEASVDVAFLVTASELLDRKKKRRAPEPPHISEAIRRLVDLGLKAKPR
jgi:hypothetical protein